MVNLTHMCLKHYIYSFVFILIASCVASIGIDIDVYRLIQYDICGAPFGSRVASLNHFARSSISAASASDLSRSVIILYLYEFNETFLQEYIEGGKPLGGLLVLLPHVFRPDNTRTTPCDSDYTLEKKQLAYLEQKLIHSTIQYPVYFAFEHQGLAKVLADIRRNDAVGKPATTATGGYKLVVTSPTPKKRGISTIINIQGWLPGLKADGDSKQLPTIAIVASYDTFGAVPALSVGSDSNGSGVVALLEIARLFSVLYSNSSTRGRYNILFALTSAGPYNYNGTHTWLRSLDQRLLESIDYAICLNSLGSTENKLWLHTSKPPENTYVKQIFEGLSNVAKELDIDVGLKHKELNVSNSRVAWEHEHFSRLGVTAATLSRLSVAPNFLEVTGGISDKIEFIKEEAIVQSVKLVTRCLARQIYGQEGKNLLADKSGEAVNHLYIKSLLHFLSKSPRVAPYIFFDITSLVAVKRIYEELAHHVVEVRNRYGDIDDQMFTFYDSAVNTLHISQVAGVSSNMFWKPILGEYLFALLFLFIFTGMRVILYVLYLCGKVEALCRVQNEQDH